MVRKKQESPTEYDELCSAWLSYWRLPKESQERASYRWASMEFYDISQDQPWLCLTLIERLLESELEGNVFSVLAAGPMEDILARHGAEIIEAVEVKARQNPKFRELLGGVWQNAMPNDIWERIKAARQSAW